MFVICFMSQWMKRSKHGLFNLPPKKTLIWRRHCLIGQSPCSMTSKRSIELFLESSWDEVFSPERLPNQPKATCVCVRSINQSNFRSCFVSVSLFALFCFKVMRKSLYVHREPDEFSPVEFRRLSVPFTRIKI